MAASPVSFIAVKDALYVTFSEAMLTPGTFTLVGHTVSAGAMNAGNNRLASFPLSPAVTYGETLDDSVQQTVSGTAVSGLPAGAWDSEIFADCVNATPSGVGSTEPGRTTAYITAYDVENSVAADVVFEIYLYEGSGTAGHSYDRRKLIVSTDGSGVASIELFQSSTYMIRRQMSAGVFGPFVIFTTDANSSYAIPEVVGKLTTV